MNKQSETTEVVKIRLGSTIKSQLQKLAHCNQRRNPVGLDEVTLGEARVI